MAVPYTLLITPKFRAFDLAGLPLSGGMVYIYEAGTTLPKASYTTPAMTAANTWPVVLDANGQADVWVSGPFKAIVTDADGVHLYSQDSLYGFGGIYASMPNQDDGKLLAWANVDGSIVNSTMNITEIETAVTAFNEVIAVGGTVVSAASGDANPGVLDAKLEVGRGLTKSVVTLPGDVKQVLIEGRPVGARLFLHKTYAGL